MKPSLTASANISFLVPQAPSHFKIFTLATPMSMERIVSEGKCAIAGVVECIMFYR